MQNQQITEEIQNQDLPVKPAEWMTIRQIQERTGANVDTIRQSIIRVQKKGATWIKREGQGKRDRWLINVVSPEYRTIEECWLKKAKSSLPTTEAMQKVEQSAQIDTPTIDPRTERLNYLVAQWTEFGVWAADWGLVVYRNAIERDPAWNWAWRNSASFDYASKMEAFIAALQHQLLYGEPLAGRAWKRRLSVLFTRVGMWISWICALFISWFQALLAGLIRLWNWLMA